mmetsp:Transcript_26660/g.56705  ORF Transcript_26660/g.56705 Transcript_26660/m.56705 type:complete len:97 (+) Transcript_26660:479-769(+)
MAERLRQERGPREGEEAAGRGGELRAAHLNADATTSIVCSCFRGSDRAKRLGPSSSDLIVNGNDSIRAWKGPPTPAPRPLDNSSTLTLAECLASCR